MNAPKPKQLEQRRPKQREVIPLKYRIMVDRSRRLPHLPRPMIRKYAPGGLSVNEEGHTKGAQHEEAPEH